jgi:AcrR family transcriptional regulator
MAETRRAVRGAADAKIASATLGLLRSKGPAAVTIEGVAAASGVARTTIYRRYADRGEMLAAALIEVGVPEPVDAGASADDRLRWVIDRAGAMIVDGIGLGGIAALITDADPEFAEVFRHILGMHRAVLQQALRGTGGLREGIATETVIDAVVGALVAEHARTGGIADGWQERMFRLFGPAVMADG